MENYRITSRRRFLKAMAIGAGGYAAGAMLIQPTMSLAQSVEENMAKIPMEARWAMASGSYIRPHEP